MVHFAESYGWWPEGSELSHDKMVIFQNYVNAYQRVYVRGNIWRCYSNFCRIWWFLNGGINSLKFAWNVTPGICLEREELIRLLFWWGTLVLTAEQCTPLDKAGHFQTPAVSWSKCVLLFFKSRFNGHGKGLYWCVNSAKQVYCNLWKSCYDEMGCVS